MMIDRRRYVHHGDLWMQLFASNGSAAADSELGEAPQAQVILAIDARIPHVGICFVA